VRPPEAKGKSDLSRMLNRLAELSGSDQARELAERLVGDDQMARAALEKVGGRMDCDCIVGGIDKMARAALEKVGLFGRHIDLVLRIHIGSLYYYTIRGPRASAAEW
jgi:hypothetical protein